MIENRQDPIIRASTFDIPYVPATRTSQRVSVIMVVLEKVLMVFILGQMAFEEPIEKVEQLEHFLIRHPFGNQCHEPVVGKFLHIIYQRIFIGFPVRAISHQAPIIFDKMVRMVRHLL
jgi:hypothetical protein